MSSSLRKVGFYVLSLPLRGQEDSSDEIRLRKPQLLIKSLKYGMQLNPEKRILKIKKAKRAHHIEHYHEDVERKEYEVVFISGKYEHCPPIYDVDTAESKPSTKTLREAEKEASHLVLRIVGNDIFLLLEERRVGISIIGVVYYLKWIVEQYHESIGSEMDYDIDWAILPKGTFEEEYKKLLRVSSATLRMDVAPICSDALEYSGSIRDLKEDVEIILRSKRGQSIRDIIASKIPWLERKDKKRIHRIRVVGYDEHNKKSILDTELIKRMEEIDIELDSTTGTVIKPEELFKLMKQQIRLLS